ncbi:hypothetical protein WKI71_43390 [Streptomyces sp. MS1.AVA.1]|uniref:GNAT family N-acetyltransferase n=1 Tax=Streptomyces machairae TaxID=3134109 RepID=A0ABU8UWW6_9ACTN
MDEPVGWIDADRYLDELKQGMYRPEWTWIAEDDGRIVGRSLWWGRQDSAHPSPWTVCMSTRRSPTAWRWRPDC